MAHEVKKKSVKKSVEPRTYVSAKREAQARATRAAILEAARTLFLERGYATTTIQAIADEAGVAVQTIYAGFGNKREVLKQLTDVSLAGDDEPVEISDREEVKAIGREPDAQQRARMTAAVMRAMMERAAAVFKIVRDAASADTEVAELFKAMSVGRRHGMLDAAQGLAGPDRLRDPIDDAAATLFVLLSPDVALMLTGELGWTMDRYEAWLVEMIERTLLP